MSGACGVTIGSPNKIKVNVPNGKLACFGYVRPASSCTVSVWLEAAGWKIVGRRIPHHRPYQWAFLLESVPIRQFATLIAEATYPDGTVTRDSRQLLCMPAAPGASAKNKVTPDDTSVTIDVPDASPPSVPACFNSFGWVSDTAAQISAWIEQGHGNTVATGTAIEFDPDVYDWGFGFTTVGISGDVTLNVAANGSSAQQNITIDPSLPNG